MKEKVMNRTCSACSARLDQQAPTCPQCGANLASSGTNGTTSGPGDRNTAVVAHLSTFAGLVLPFGRTIVRLADPTQRGLHSSTTPDGRR